jgi:hypothetical protein
VGAILEGEGICRRRDRKTQETDAGIAMLEVPTLSLTGMDVLEVPTLGAHEPDCWKFQQLWHIETVFGIANIRCVGTSNSSLSQPKVSHQDNK